MTQVAKETLQQDEFFTAHMRLVEAASRIYFAGVWLAQESGLSANEQKKMWEDLRDALGLKPGAATAAGVGAVTSGGLKP